jgi:hypothetical protein
MANKPNEGIHTIGGYTKAFFRLAMFLLTLFVIVALFASTITDLLNPTSQEPPLTTMFALLVATALMEFSIRRFWPRLYYRIGIPVLIRNYSINLVESLPTDFGHISGTIKAEGMWPQIVFIQLSKLEYGLWANKTAGKSQGRKSSYNPLTRGYISLDKEKLQLKMRVHLNWTSLPFIIFWFGVVFLGPSLGAKLIFGPIGLLIFSLLSYGEVQQYLKGWYVVKKYACGEIKVDDIVVELAQTNKPIA